jgi:hypothetical protein
MKFFEEFRAAFAKANTPPTAGRLAALLDDAQRELAAAERRREKIEAGRADALLAGEAERLKHREDLALAVADVADAEEATRILAARFAEAEASEAEAVRRQRYEAAEAQTVAAAKKLRSDYVKHARGLADLLRVVADADAAVEAANCDLPEGVDPLLATEDRVRDIPGEPRKILRDERCHRWISALTGNFIVDEAIVQDLGRGRGVIHVPAASEHHYARPNRHEVDRVLCREVEFLPSVSRKFGPRLAELVLPGLRAGDAEIWSPAQSTSPDAILDRLDALAEEPPTERPARIPQIERERLADDLTERAQ